MNGPVLSLLAVIVAGLLLLGSLGLALRHRAREAIGFGGAGLCGLAGVLALAMLLAADAPAQLALPIGLPGGQFRMSLDALSGFFALLVFGAGAAAIAYAAEAGTPGPPVSLAGMVVAAAGLGLAALAGDCLLFAGGLALAGGATWAAGRTDPATRSDPGVLAATLIAAAVVVAVGFLPGATGGQLGFAGPRAAESPEMPAAVAWLALVIGLAPLAGLLPVRRSRAVPPEAAPPLAAAVLANAAMPLALYALLRVLSALPDRPLPIWCGLTLVALGVAALLTGGIRAARADTLDAVLAAAATRHSGTGVAALGLAVTADALDLSQVAGLALAAMLVAAAVQAVCGTLAVLCADAIRRSAATRQLCRLGGVIHTMPACTACLLAALFGLAALPPGPGFAVTWLIFQALLAELQSVPAVFQAIFIATAAALGLGAALSTVALVRTVGVVCLGRPRTPRTAAAKPLSRRATYPLLCLAGASLLLGMFVGPVLRLLAGPAIHQAIGTGIDRTAGLPGVAALPGGRGYAALPATLLLVLAWRAAVAMRRRLQPADGAASPAWNEGFAAPPAWLPFGEPLTQTSGIGFTPLPEPVPSPAPAIRRAAHARVRSAAVAVAILAIMLAMLRLLP